MSRTCNPPVSGPSKTEFWNSHTELVPLLFSRPETVVKLLIYILPTSQPPPDKPERYVADCNSPPKCPDAVEFASRESKAWRTPPPVIHALYPPPETAIPIFGNIDVLLWWLLKYAFASKPAIFSRLRNCCMAGMVLFLRTCSHDVSCGDSPSALRNVGLFEGHAPPCGT